jgi:hypothetical protein
MSSEVKGRCSCSGRSKYQPLNAASGASLASVPTWVSSLRVTLDSLADRTEPSLT